MPAYLVLGEDSARYDDPYVAPDGTVVSNRLLSKMMRRMLREESIRSQLEGAGNTQSVTF